LSGGSSDVFNLGRGRGYSVREIIRAAGNVTQKEIKTRESGRRKGDPAVLICSSEKIKKTLSWEPKFGSLDAILNTAWNWHRK
jgi:UDP-glucose 4-epimerase